MKTTKALILTLGLAAIMTACGKHADNNLSGSWTSAAPINVTATVDGATSASKTLTFDFVAPAEKGAAGDVTLTADYDVTASYATDSVTESRTYQVTASVKGTYSQAKDDDEYLLSFDRNSISVQGTDAPELGPVTDDFINSLGAFTSIEDVETSKDGTHLFFETDKPDVKYTFVKK